MLTHNSTSPREPQTQGRKKVNGHWHLCLSNGGTLLSPRDSWSTREESVSRRHWGARLVVGGVGRTNPIDRRVERPASIRTLLPHRSRSRFGQMLWSCSGPGWTRDSLCSQKTRLVCGHELHWRPSQKLLQEPPAPGRGWEWQSRDPAPHLHCGASNTASDRDEQSQRRHVKGCRDIFAAGNDMPSQ